MDSIDDIISYLKRHEKDFETLSAAIQKDRELLHKELSCKPMNKELICSLLRQISVREKNATDSLKDICVSRAKLLGLLT